MTLVMHHHIFKNGGSTVDWILHKNFPGGVLHVEGNSSGARLTPAQIKDAVRPFPGHQAITSHCTPLPPYESKWAQLHLTLLRDPIDRVYSMYRFDRRRPDETPGGCIAKERSFRGYVEWWLKGDHDTILSNWQVRCCTPQLGLSGGGKSRTRKGWNADLNAARSAIENFVFAGTVEDFDESMLLLECRLRQQGIPFDASYLRRNTAPREPHGEDNTRDRVLKLLGKPLHELLLELNTKDHDLFGLARRLVRERFSELDDAQQRLEEFRERCRALADLKAATPVLDRAMKFITHFSGKGMQSNRFRSRLIGYVRHKHPHLAEQLARHVGTGGRIIISSGVDVEEDSSLPHQNPSSN